MQSLRTDIDRVLEKISTIYLRSKKMDKPSIYSTTSNETADSYPVYGQVISSQNSMTSNSQNLHYSQK